MPMIDFRCECGAQFEKFFHVTQAGSVDSHVCECGATAKRYYEYRRPHSYAGLSDPVVLHQDIDGHYLVPAHRDAPVPEGCTRVEFRDIQAIRRAESQMNAHELSKWERTQEMEDRTFGE